MKIILVGIQGAGKSTQGNLLADEFGVPYLSSGHIFRQIAKEKTRMGRWVKETMNSGALIPDDTVMEIVTEYLDRPEYEKGYILDGFPRTVAQAKDFKNGVKKVVFIDVTDKEALWRISGRITDDREDETLRALRKRIELFHKETKPVLSYYKKQGKLVTVDGEQEVADVFQDILKEVKK